MSRPTGIRLIILYKGARALLQLAAAVALFVASRDGRTNELVSWAIATRQQVGHVVWEDVARLVLAGALHLSAVGAALAMDASLAAFEAFALLRGYAWAGWLVVGTTLSPLPWEVAGLIRHPRPLRLLIMLINLAIVAYLVTRARRHGHDERVDSGRRRGRFSATPRASGSARSTPTRS